MKLRKKYSSQEMAEEMNEQKILALARTAQDAIIFQRKGREIFIFIFLFRNAFRSRIVCLNAGFVSLESVTGIKSAYSQNECTFPARGLSLPAFCEDKQTILCCHSVALMLTHIRKLFEIHPKIFHYVLKNPKPFYCGLNNGY